MRNKTVTVTAAELNSNSIKIFSLEELVPLENVLEQFKRVIPSEMRIYNTTGCDIEYLLLDGAAEETQFNNGDPLFSFLRVLNGMWVHHHPLEKSTRLYVRKKSGTASSDLDIEFIGFVRRG